jgi:hypothetical protein
MYFGPIQITLNKLSKVNISGTNYMMGSAIEVMKSDQFTQSTPQIDGTVNVSFNTISDAGYGILMRNINQASACRDNRISIDGATQANVSYGIRHEGCSNEWTNNNAVSGFGPSGTDTAAGIYTSGGSKHYVICNKVRDFPRGFEFFTPATNVQWRGNEMTNNTQSFRLTKSRIGNQQSNGWASENKWLADGGFSYSGNNFQTFIWNTTGTFTTMGALQSKLFVTTGSTTNPISNNNASPFNINNPPYSAGNGIYTTQIIGFEACPTKVSKKDIDHSKEVIMGRYYNGEFQGTLNFIEQYDLWQALRYPDTLVDDTTGLLADFAALGTRGRYGMITAIDSALNDGDTALVRLLINDPLLFTPVTGSGATGAILDDDTTANRVVANYVKIYNIFLKYLDSSMTSDDSARVDSIANLCVLLDGNSVYMARSFYAVLYEDQREYNDLCMVTSEVGIGQGRHVQGSGNPIAPFSLLTQDEKNAAYVLHPSPNNGNFGVRQAVADDRPVDVEVLNSIGASVYKNKIQFINRQAFIKLGNVSTGSYLLKIVNKEREQFIIKFTIL